MRQFLRFCVVGASNTAITLVSFAVAVSAGVPYIAASCGAFALGALNGYSLNRIWTFRAGGFSSRGLARYGLAQGLSLAVNAGLLALLVEDAGMPKVPAQAIVLPLVSALTFVVNRQWVFATPPRERAGAAV